MKDKNVINAEDIDVVSGLSTGIDKLNALLGCGGLPQGRISTFTGDFSSGKTALALQCLSEAQKHGYTTVFADVERSFSKEQAIAIGVNLKELDILRGLYGEDVLDSLEEYMLKRKKVFAVLDSYSALSPKAEMESSTERAGMMEKSRMMAKFLRKMTNIVPETESVLLIIAHDYLTVLPGGRQKNVMAGGDQMVKAPSVWLKLYARPIKEGDSRVGSIITIRQKKNKVGGIQDAECELNYRFDTGFERELPALEKGLADGSITKDGNTFYLNGEKLGTISKARAALAERLTNTTT